MEHIVRFEAGYDCIKFECKFDSKTCEPGAGDSHGKHGLSIRFVVKDKEGAVQFLLFTDWMPHLVEPSSSCFSGARHCEWGGQFQIMPADLGYHSKMPRYQGQTVIDDHCEFCDGQPCYYDGSSLSADDAMYALVNGGDAALWGFLEGYYASVFGDATYPTPAEYAKPLRKQTL